MAELIVEGWGVLGEEPSKVLERKHVNREMFIALPFSASLIHTHTSPCDLTHSSTIHDSTEAPLPSKATVSAEGSYITPSTILLQSASLPVIPHQPLQDKVHFIEVISMYSLIFDSSCSVPYSHLAGSHQTPVAKSAAKNAACFRSFWSD